MGLFKELKKLETDDYQNRKGAYPKNGIPDSIRVNKKGSNIIVSIEFKNTSGDQAKKWFKSNFEISQDEIININTEQTGDYWDDWVTLEVTYKGDE